MYFIKFPVAAANKYKIGLAIEGVTGSSVSAIERDVLPAQMYNIIVQTTDGSSENPTSLEYSKLNSKKNII